MHGQTNNDPETTNPSGRERRNTPEVTQDNNYTSGPPSSDSSNDSDSDSDSSDSNTSDSASDNEQEQNNNNNNINQDDQTTPNSGRTPRRRKRRNRRRGKRTNLHDYLPPPTQPRSRGHAKTEDVGDVLEERRDGFSRIAYGNVGGFHRKSTQNPVTNALRNWMKEAEIDQFNGVESNLNWRAMPRHGRLDEWFRSENALRVSAAHNTNENSGRKQYGGAFQLTFGQMAARVTEVGNDPTGLGRWTWTKFTGRGGIVTRVIVAYAPCRSEEPQQSTVISQQRRYYRLRHDKRCPRDIMLDELRQQLVQWRQAGERLMIMMDVNEDATTGRFQRMLRSHPLRMRSLHQDLHPDPKWKFTATHKRGRRPIDGAWATPDIQADRSTWLSFTKSISDHRFWIVEIDTKILLGEDIKRIVRPQARRLSCAVPRVKGKYVDIFEKQAKRHRLLERHYELGIEIGNNNATPDQAKRLEKLDRQKAEIMHHAAKKCRHLCMGQVDFSPPVNIAGMRVRVWELVIKRKTARSRKEKVNAALIRRMAKKCDIERPMSVGLRQARRSLRAADQVYQELKSRHPDHRKDFLRKRAKNDDGTLTKAEQKAAKRLLYQERNRSDFRQVKGVLGRLRGGAITAIQIKQNGMYIEKTTKEDVERHTMDMCEQRFRLTENTPPMQEPLRSELGLLGQTEAAQQILAGTYECPDGVDDYTRSFIDSLVACAPAQEPKISCKITKDDYQSFWKKCNERTSSSISGLHYGHYKAAVDSDYLSELHAIQLQINVRAGHSLKRWQKGLSCMLEKVLGVIVVDKLRAILLMEADFNMYNGLMFAVRMMNNAEENDWIPDEIYARRDREAIEVGMNRMLFNDLARLRRVPASIASVDANTCYDRIAHSIGSIGAQRWGVHPVAVGVMLLTIQSMIFYLRTGFGDSTKSFGRSGTPFQGACQGNKAAGAIWLGTSSPLVEMMHNRGQATDICTALSLLTLALIGFLFVDDTDLLELAENAQIYPHEIIARTQEKVTTWQGGLRASGGALMPRKCMWGLIAFKWSNGKWSYDHPPGEIMVTDLNGNPKAIKRYDAHTAIKIVGVYQALDGNMDRQLQELLAKAKDWGGKIRQGCIPRNLAYRGVHSMLWASIKYPLPATTFTDAQGKLITSRLFTQVLPKMGAVRSFPHVFRNAPFGMLGLNLPHGKVDQEIEHLKRILMHGPIDSPTGHLLRATYEQAQLEVGTSTPFFELSFDTYGDLLTDCLWKCMWEFCSKHNIRLQWDCHKLILPRNQREGDSFIVERLVEAGVTGADLCSCNKVRISIKALTMADISTAEGTRIRSDAISGDMDIKSKYIWAHEQPGSVDLSRWQKQLKYLSSDDYTFSIWDRLGRWILGAHLHQKREWVYHPPSGTLYRYDTFFDPPVWHRYERSSRTRNSRFHRVAIDTTEPDDLDDLKQADVYLNSRREPRLQQFCGFTSRERPNINSIYDLIDTWDYNWPLNDSGFPNDPTNLIDAITTGRALGCCDGSYQDVLSTEIAAASWKIEDPVSGDYMGGNVPCSGTPNEVNPYRAELQGYHALLLGLKAFCTYYQITEGYIRTGFDNKLGVQRADDDRQRVVPRISHGDLVRAIRLMMSEIPIEISVEHVYGHQDDLVRYDDLPRLAQLNVQMDSCAKAKVVELATQDPDLSDHQAIHSEGWRVWVDDVKVTSDPGPAIRRSIFGKNLRHHLHSRHKMSAEAFDKTDWDSIERAAKKLPHLFRLWMAKHASGCFGNGKKMLLWKFWKHSRCPCCSCPVEDKPHLMTCPDGECEITWDHSIDNVELWMDMVDTDPRIQDSILMALRSRTLTYQFPLPDNDRHDIRQAKETQNLIGWLNLTEGKLAKEWLGVQQTYYRNNGIDRSAHTWAAGLVTEILYATHAQWVYRNSIQHERDRRGLKLKDAAELDESIRVQFELGIDGLHERDHHFITRRQETVAKYTVTGQRDWLNGILVARQTYDASEARSQQQMRSLMAHWLR